MAKVFSFTSVLRKNMMEKDKPDLYYACLLYTSDAPDEL